VALARGNLGKGRALEGKTAFLRIGVSEVRNKRAENLQKMVSPTKKSWVMDKACVETTCKKLTNLTGGTNPRHLLPTGHKRLMLANLTTRSLVTREEMVTGNGASARGLGSDPQGANLYEGILG